MDRGRLSLVLLRAWRRLAGRRPCRAGGGQGRPWAEDAPDAEADGAAGGALATAARRRRASVVGLLQGAEGAGRRDRGAGKPDDEIVPQRAGQAWLTAVFSLPAPFTSL